jgi:hypothetical protein
VREHAPVPSSRLRTRSTAALWAGCALGAAVGVGLGGELSSAAHLAVLAAGAVVVGLGLVNRTGAGSRPVAPPAGRWLVWPALALAWEAVALVHGDLPTVSDLLDPLLAPAVVRAAATVAWVAAGAWLATRPGPAAGAAMRTTTRRLLVLLTWLWAGLHFLAR